LSEHLHRLLPGILLCVAITGVAILFQAVEVYFIGQAYLEALVLAILLGVAVRTAWVPTPRFISGLTFSAKFLLECAVVVLGASVSIATVLALGPLLLVGIASVVAMALGVSFVIDRVIGLPLRMAILIACGNSICVNSAIAAVAPVIGADSDDIAASISFTAVLGVIVVLTLPLLVPVLQLSLTQYVGRADRLRGATGAGGDVTHRRVEQSSRHRRQARASFDARPGGARAVATGARSAHDRLSHLQKHAKLARARALVHHGLSHCPDRPVGRPDPASRVADDH
jgi:hypothetical protein